VIPFVAQRYSTVPNPASQVWLAQQPQFEGSWGEEPLAYCTEQRDANNQQVIAIKIKEGLSLFAIVEEHQKLSQPLLPELLMK
jgi:hypothetical protein